MGPVEEIAQELVVGVGGIRPAVDDDVPPLIAAVPGDVVVEGVNPDPVTLPTSTT